MAEADDEDDKEQRSAQQRLTRRPRWLETPEIVEVHENLALEEAIFWSMKNNDDEDEEESFTVRLWENSKSVIIGRGQYAPYETDLEYCASYKIPLVRRFTGGGAIYNGPGNLNWSLFVAEDRRGGRPGLVRFERGVREIFRMGADVVIETLRRLGTRAWLDVPNRIVTSEGKVSGMAAYLAKGKLLCHGTLLLNADLEEAQRLTKPRELPKAESRYVRSRYAKIANLGIEAGTFGRTLREVMNLEGEGIGEEGLTRVELEMAERLIPKYRSREWNLGDPFMVGDGPN